MHNSELPIRNIQQTALGRVTGKGRRKDKEKIKRKKKIDSWKEAAAGQENHVQSKASQRPGGDFF